MIMRGDFYMIYNFDIEDVWYDIPAYPGYQINRDGIVRSMKFMYYDPGKIMNVRNGKITLSASGKKKVESVFNLLNMTFFENKPVQNNNIDYSELMIS